MRLRSSIAGSAILALAASGLAGSTALATPATGGTPTPNPPPLATLDGPVKAASDGIKLKITDDAVVRNFTLTYKPSTNSGWHQHPGIVLAVVTSGTVYRKAPCHHAHRFTTGQAFTEVGPHFVENRGDTDATLTITQIGPRGTTGPTFREDLPAPKCGPRT